jgi:hypothetical protein
MMIKLVYHPQPPERGLSERKLGHLGFCSKYKQKEKMLDSALQKPLFRGLGVVLEILQNFRLIFFNI